MAVRARTISTGVSAPDRGSRMPERSPASGCERYSVARCRSAWVRVSCALSVVPEASATIHRPSRGNTWTASPWLSAEVTVFRLCAKPGCRSMFFISALVNQPCPVASPSP